MCHSQVFFFPGNAECSCETGSRWNDSVYVHYRCIRLKIRKKCRFFGSKNDLWTKKMIPTKRDWNAPVIIFLYDYLIWDGKWIHGAVFSPPPKKLSKIVLIFKGSNLIFFLASLIFTSFNDYFKVLRISNCNSELLV